MTALEDMAAPARPGSDARVPCPVCGGLLHPVAGRCKHCKADVAALRSRPMAAAALPALTGQPPAQAAAPIPVVAPREDSAPILPPRPTGRSQAVVEPAPSAWRRWPIVVIALAAVAIVGAVVVMVWLPPANGAPARALPPPPAPEHMETNPLPPPPHGDPGDPWGPDGTGGAQPQRPAPHAQADPADPDWGVDPLDPLPQITPTGRFASPMFAATVAKRLCGRLAQCGTSNQIIGTYCDALKAIPVPSTATQCPVGDRCLQHVDQLSCSTQADDSTALMTTVLTQLPDCFEAMTRC